MEIFDAYDKNGNALGYELIRGETIPIGVYHKIVQIYTIDEKGRILITQRHPMKHFGYYWEITAGSVLKDENELNAAVRELDEETGIKVSKDSLTLVKIYLGQNSIWFTYIHKINMLNHVIQLAKDETIDYRFISIEEFNHMIQTKQFPKPSLDYFKLYKANLYDCYTSLLMK
jgi:8-oxo-dGTP pyrophosphatase MutT (NUDIX family)